MSASSFLGPICSSLYKYAIEPIIEKKKNERKISAEIKDALEKCVDQFLIYTGITNKQDQKAFEEFLSQNVVASEIRNFLFEETPSDPSLLLYDLLIEDYKYFGFRKKLSLDRDTFVTQLYQLLKLLREELLSKLPHEIKLLRQEILGRKVISTHEYVDLIEKGGMRESEISLRGLITRMDVGSFIYDLNKLLTPMIIRRLEVPIGINFTPNYDLVDTSDFIDWSNFIRERTNLDNSGKISIIAGPAGMGKSTLMRVIYSRRGVNCINEIQNNYSDDQEFLFFIPLKTVDSSASLHSVLFNHLSNLSQEGNQFLSYWVKNSLISFIRRYRVSLFLDAVDEFPSDESFRNFFKELVYFMRKLHKYKLENRLNVFVSTRVEYIEDLRYYFQDFSYESSLLKGFNLEQSQTYTERWYQENRIVEDPQSLTEELFNKIKPKKEDLADIFSNPLLISMLAIYYATSRDLPESKFDLLEEIPRFLCQRWDTLRGVENPYLSLQGGFQKFQTFFSIVAYEMQKTGSNLLNNLEQKYFTIQREERNLRAEDIEDDFRNILGIIQERPVLGSIYQDSSFLFNMQIIEEYYSAMRASNIIVNGRIREEELWEVIKPLFKKSNQAGEIVFYLIRKFYLIYKMLINFGLKSMKKVLDRMKHQKNERAPMDEFDGLLSYCNTCALFLLTFDSKYKLENEEERTLLRFVLIMSPFSNHLKIRMKDSVTFDQLCNSQDVIYDLIVESSLHFSDGDDSYEYNLESTQNIEPLELGGLFELFEFANKTLSLKCEFSVSNFLIQLNYLIVNLVSDGFLESIKDQIIKFGENLDVDNTRNLEFVYLYLLITLVRADYSSVNVLILTDLLENIEDENDIRRNELGLPEEYLLDIDAMIICCRTALRKISRKKHFNVLS